jgi:hypothetical protein
MDSMTGSGMRPRSPVRPAKVNGNKGVFQNGAPARFITRQYVTGGLENQNGAQKETDTGAGRPSAGLIFFDSPSPPSKERTDATL